MRYNDVESEQKFFLVNNKFLILPEFLIEYNIQNPINFSMENYLVSSFFNKTEIKSDLIENFNTCLQHLIESKLISSFIDPQLLEKYKCKSIICY